VNSLTGTVFPVYGMKSYRGSGGVAPLVLNLVTIWECVIGLTPQALCHRERTPYALNRCWFFPITDMNILDKKKICCLYRNSNSGSPNLKPCRYTDYAIPVPIKRRSRLNWYNLSDLCTVPPKSYEILYQTTRRHILQDGNPILLTFLFSLSRVLDHRFLYRQRARLVFWRSFVLISVLF
jgi:hypothetical protein